LNNHVVRPEFTCRFRWKKGSLTVWDNRCVQHYAVNDYEGFSRTMLRVEMQGTRPCGPANVAAAALNRDRL
jgi:taurine dioxygenase